MTVSSSTNSASYSGNGSTTVFAYGFKIFAASDLTVTLVNDTTGVETTQTLTTHYTVSGAGTDSGGNVTFGSAPASGNTVKIERILPHTQTTTYTENDAFPSQAHEDGLDRLTMLTQQAPAYRAGTFVPAVRDAKNTGGNLATVAKAIGRYTKIGRMVHVHISLEDITTTGMTGSNGVFILNLPFSAHNTGLGAAELNAAGSMIYSNISQSTSGASWTPYIVSGASHIRFAAGANNATFESIQVNDLTSGSADMYIAIAYEASS